MFWTKTKKIENPEQSFYKECIDSKNENQNAKAWIAEEKYIFKYNQLASTNLYKHESTIAMIPVDSVLDPNHWVYDTQHDST